MSLLTPGFLLGGGLLTLGATHERNAMNLRETFGFTWETLALDATDPDQIPDAGGALKLRLVYERTNNPLQTGPRFELAYTTRF